MTNVTLGSQMIFRCPVRVADNVKTLGEEADLEAKTFSLAQKPIESTNIEFSTNTAFLPNVCYRLFLLLTIKFYNYDTSKNRKINTICK